MATEPPPVYLCMSCDTIIHAQKSTRFHQRISVTSPPNRRFRLEMVPVLVRTDELQFAMDPFPSREDGEEEADWFMRLKEHHKVLRERIFSEPTPAYALEQIPLVSDVACGDSHSVAIVRPVSTDPDDAAIGTLFAWGCGSSGRTGLCTYSPDDEERWVEEPHTLDEFFGRLVVSYASAEPPDAQTYGGAAAAADARDQPVVVLAQPVTAQQVACGGQHTIMVGMDGGVLTFGNNEHGQLGRKTENYFSHSPAAVELPLAIVVDMVACGDVHSLLVAGGGGAVYTWGYGGNGRLGHGDAQDRPTPREIDKLRVVDGAPRIAHVAGGACHSALVTEDGTLLVWGRNDSGQCGGFELPDFLKPGPKFDRRGRCPRPPDVMRPTQVLLQRAARESRRGADGGSSGQDGAYSDFGGDSATFARRSPFSRPGASMVLSSRRSAAPVSGRPSIQLSSRPASRPASLRAPSESQGSASRQSPGDGGTTRRSWAAADDDEQQATAPAPPQVACGQCHTLVMVGGRLWVLGSGLDLKDRLEDVVWESEEGKPDRARLADCFAPREVAVAFVDTAMISTRKDGDNEGDKAQISTRKDDDDEDSGSDFVFDRVRHSILAEERVLEEGEEDDDPNQRKTIDHHVFTFAYDGAIELKAGDQVAFTGPRAPDGLRLYSATDGPFFTVLGRSRRSGLARWQDKAEPNTRPEDSGEWGDTKRSAPQHFSIECPPQCLTPELDDFEKVAAWITAHVTLENDASMMVCKRGPLPLLRRVASGAFHAAALASDGTVLLWGRGSLGRLGSGNELDQLVPTVLEVEAVGPGVHLAPAMELDLTVERLELEYEEALENWSKKHAAASAAAAAAATAAAATRKVGGIAKSQESQELKVGDFVDEIDRVPVAGLGDVPSERLWQAKQLMKGLEGTMCRLTVRRELESMNEAGAIHSGASPPQLVEPGPSRRQPADSRIVVFRRRVPLD